jgi:hypothetical protein
MIYCTTCYDRHENTGECKYCDCTISLPDAGRPYVRASSDMTPEKREELREKMRAILEKNSRFNKAAPLIRQYSDLTLIGVLERLSEAELTLELKGYFWCHRCNSYQEGQCICYAR